VKRAGGRPMLVQASLRGVTKEWSAPQTDAAFEFTALRAGNYTFHARAVDRFGRFGPELTLSFLLAPRGIKALLRSSPMPWPACSQSARACADACAICTD